MNRFQAAEELIRAYDQARELSRLGRLTKQDVDRVNTATRNYEHHTFWGKVVVG